MGRCTTSKKRSGTAALQKTGSYGLGSRGENPKSCSKRALKGCFRVAIGSHRPGDDAVRLLAQQLGIVDLHHVSRAGG